MHEIAEENHMFQRGELTREDALRKFKDEGETFKVELIEGLPDPKLSTYTHSFFTDLCRGPHVPRTKMLKHFKLLSVAGAYWRRDSNRPMLQRIYGTAFPSKDRLKEHLTRLEQAKLRDHRKVGHTLDLYSIQEEAGGGLIFWHPHGAAMRRVIEDFWKSEHLKRGYTIVNTPHIAQVDLWQRLGFRFHRENMYFLDIDGEGCVCSRCFAPPISSPGKDLHRASSQSDHELSTGLFSEREIWRAPGLTPPPRRDAQHLHCPEQSAWRRSSAFADSCTHRRSASGPQVELSVRSEAEGRLRAPTTTGTRRGPSSAW
jgi:hypothetical protein